MLSNVSERADILSRKLIELTDFVDATQVLASQHTLDAVVFRFNSFAVAVLCNRRDCKARSRSA